MIQQEKEHELSDFMEELYAPMTKQDSTTGVEKELSPCYCRTGASSLSIKQHIDHGEFGCRTRGYYVYCSNCWTCGPAASTEADAIKYWDALRVNSYDSLRSQNEALRESLETMTKRGHCDRPCPKSTAWYPEESTCTCGMDQLQEALEAKQ